MRRSAWARTPMLVVALAGVLIVGESHGDANGGPVVIEVPAPPAVRAAGGKQLAEFRLGRNVAAQSGCLACHKIGHQGNRGPGPNLTHVGSRLPRLAIERTLERPTPPMPSFKGLKRQRRAKFRALTVFPSLLRENATEGRIEACPPLDVTASNRRPRLDLEP